MLSLTKLSGYSFWRRHIAASCAFLLVCLAIWPATSAGTLDKKQLDWLETFLKEYSDAADAMCQDGKYIGCEVADGARLALQTFKDARQGCRSGNQKSCDRVMQMAPRIADQTTDVCPQFQLKDCPKSPELIPNDEGQPPAPAAGYYDYQGEQLPGYVPSTHR
jgi:hypothetical protein